MDSSSICTKYCFFVKEKILRLVFCVLIFWDRSEKGTYFALDLPDTNFRVSRVQLGGTRSSTLVRDVYQQPIPQNVVTGTSEVTEFLLPEFINV